ILAEKLKPYVIDSVYYLNKAIKEKKKVLVEGANALMLDLDWGTYPYVTSSNTTVRVGGGPFPTEQLNEIGEYLQTVGFEIGVTTGRKRRCGWLDMVVVNYSTIINGYTSLNITKLDILDQLDEIKIGVAYEVDGQILEGFPANLSLLERVEVVYETVPGWKTDISKCRVFEDLPVNAQKYIRRIEDLCGVPVEWIGVGVDREDMVVIPQA
ncbi:hypothetical protein BGZ98_005254, partial [Dissophora globulifera]